MTSKIDATPFYPAWIEPKYNSDKILSYTVIALGVLLGGLVSGVIAFHIFHLSVSFFLITTASSIGVGLGLKAITHLVNYCEIKAENKKLKKYPATPYRKIQNFNQIDLFTKKNQHVLNEVITGFGNQSWFYAYKTLKGFSNEKVKHHFWKELKEGLCTGFVFNLKDLIHDTPMMDSKSMMANLSLNKLFEYQMKLSILVDLCKAVDDEKKEEYREEKVKLYYLLFTNECGKYELYTTTKQQPFVKWIENKINETHSFCFTVEIQPKNRNGHVFFIQVDRHYRLYDSLSESTGLYEFPDLQTLLEQVHSHIHSYDDREEIIVCFFARKMD